MMSNKNVILAFLNEEQAKSLSLFSTGDKLFSYNTCIAEWLTSDTILININKYSVTTSKHLTLLRNNIKNQYSCIEINKQIDRGTQSLIQFLSV